MSTQILIDVNLSPNWVNELAAKGWPALHWSTIGDPRATDRESWTGLVLIITILGVYVNSDGMPSRFIRTSVVRQHASVMEAQEMANKRPSTVAEPVRAAPGEGQPHLRRLFAILEGRECRCSQTQPSNRNPWLTQTQNCQQQKT